MDALYEKGLSHFNKRQFDEAITCLAAPARSNHPGALFLLGYLYHYGFGVGTDYIKAKAYYEYAIEYGNTQAHHFLSYLYMEGKGTPIDREKGLQQLIEGYKKDPNKSKVGDMVFDYRNEIASSLVHLKCRYKIIDMYMQSCKDTSILQDQISDLKNEIRDLKVQIHYQPGGLGYMDAKSDFEKHVSQT